MNRNTRLLHYVTLLLSFVTIALSAPTVEFVVYGNRPNPRNIPQGSMMPNPRFDPNRPQQGSNVPQIPRPPYTGPSVDLVGYLGVMADIPDNNLDKMEELARQAYKDMEIKHQQHEAANRALPQNDPKKRTPTDIPTMMTAIRPGGPGTPIYFHSSIRGSERGKGPNDLPPGAKPIHPAISIVLDECEDYYGISHKNEANCGEIMATNAYALDKLANDELIDLVLVRSKLVASVMKDMKRGSPTFNQIIIVSPCSIARNSEGVLVKKWGCNKFVAKIGFQICEVAWSPGEAPTEIEWSALKQRRWLAGLEYGSMKLRVRQARRLAKRTNPKKDKNKAGGVNAAGGRTGSVVSPKLAKQGAAQQGTGTKKDAKKVPAQQETKKDAKKSAGQQGAKKATANGGKKKPRKPLACPLKPVSLGGIGKRGGKKTAAAGKKASGGGAAAGKKAAAPKQQAAPKKSKGTGGK